MGGVVQGRKEKRISSQTDGTITFLSVTNCRGRKRREKEQERKRESVRGGAGGEVGQVWERQKGVCSHEPLFPFFCH